MVLAAVLFIILPVFFGCENDLENELRNETGNKPVNNPANNVTENEPGDEQGNEPANPPPEDNSFTEPLAMAVPIQKIAYSAAGPDVSRFLEWQWAKEDKTGELDFTYFFKNNGTVSVTHCCGLEFENSFSYLFRGNVLVTYGSEMETDKIEATTFTMANNDVSFTRSSGQKFTRGDKYTDAGSSPPLALTNALLGEWQEKDGTKYEFNSSAELRITTSSGYGLYGYLVRNNRLLILGPLVDGSNVSLREYQFNKKDNILDLKSSDGKTVITTLAK